jgi:hypothetical protein
MGPKLVHATVRDGPRKVIHAVRVLGGPLELAEVNDIAGRMREYLLGKHGEQFAAVVIVQGRGKETLRLFGEPYAVSRVRAAMFHAAVNWRPIDLIS